MKQIFRASVPFWVVMLILFVMGTGMLALFSFFHQTVFNYALSLPEAGEMKNYAFSYGERPSLSDPDFFKKTKDEFVAKKVNFIEADLSEMRLRLYKQGILKKEVSILTKGKEGSWWETPAGIYKIGTKEKNHFSSFGHVFQPWSMTFQGNFFIHGWPYHPDGTPVASAYSGGCIRLSDEDAKSIYELADVGMPVLVFEKDFASDEFSYKTKTPDLNAAVYFAADIKNNFVFLEKESKASIPLGSFSQLLGALVGTDYINIEKKITLTEEMVSGTNESRLLVGEEVTPFDILHLGLVGSSTAPIKIFGNILNERRFSAFMNDKARAVGMSHTADDVTTSEDLFYLAKYIYNSRNFIFKMSAGDLKNNTYEESQFKNILNNNIFYDNLDFFGGKVAMGSDGTESFMGVFHVQMGSEKRPIFIFLGESADVKTDVQKILSYSQEAYH